MKCAACPMSVTGLSKLCPSCSVALFGRGSVFYGREPGRFEAEVATHDRRRPPRGIKGAVSARRWRVFGGAQVGFPGVYVLRAIDDERYWKVGEGASVEKRVMGIAAGCPFLVSLFCAAASGDRFALEGKLKRATEGLRSNGEWRRVADAADMSRRIAHALGGVRIVTGPSFVGAITEAA